MKPIIYQLVVRYFGNTNLTHEKDGDLETNGCGKFNDVSTIALQSLRALGVTHLWLTGCLRQATLTDYYRHGMPADNPNLVKGTAGSFYAVRDYYDVCPDYATSPELRLKEFQGLIERAHGLGLKVIIDLVANHVSRAYHSVICPELDFGKGDEQDRFFARDNHFFYTGEPGEALQLTKPEQWNPPWRVFDGHYEEEDGTPGHRPKVTANNNPTTTPSPNDWYDGIKLNYGYDFTTGKGEYEPRPRTWDFLNEVIAYWQAEGVDGFRCDMAHMMPAEFWHFLIEQARERDANAYFLAEAYFGWGGNDPVHGMTELTDAGFDAIYHDETFKALRRIYQQKATLAVYDQELGYPPIPRQQLLEYLENHDELRVPSPVRPDDDAGNSGFGSVEASYQLAPLQILHSGGPALIFNGQELGEPGSSGDEGWPIRPGQTNFFDYGAMPAVARWVNNHSYDERNLLPEQVELRRFYSALLRLAQDAAIRGDGYWGLSYYNNPERAPNRPADLFSFARFQPGSGRLIVVVANFRPNADTEGHIALPAELLSAAGLSGSAEIRLLLSRAGQESSVVTNLTLPQLQEDGFPVTIPNQTTLVFSVRAVAP